LRRDFPKQQGASIHEQETKIPDSQGAQKDEYAENAYHRHCVVFVFGVPYFTFSAGLAWYFNR